MKKKISAFVGSRIKEYRKRMKYTQKDLGDRIGVKHNTISSYEKGTNEPEQEILFKLADVLGVSINDFFPYENNNIIQFPASSQYPKYPKVSAGLPIEIDGITKNEVETISIPDYLMGKWAGNSNIYFTRTNGDSMNRVIPHDSLIAVKPVESHELKNNDIVVYRKHREYAVKRFIRDEDRLIFKPDSTDDRFADDVVYLDNVGDLAIKGKVVMWIVTTD